jgi:hypothetical protein
MAGPWEKYQAAPQADGPWTKYQPKPAEIEAPRTIGGLNTGLAQGMTANLADELFAVGMTPIEMGIAAYKGQDDGKGLMQRMSEGYDRALEGNRAMFKQAREDDPIASTVGDVTGALMTGGALAKGGATLLQGAKPTVASMAGRGAAEGALYGAAYGAGEGEGAQDRGQRALASAGIGALTGGVLGGVAGKVASRAGEAAVPTNEQLRSAAGRAYKAADDAGVIFTPQGLKRLQQDVQVDLAEFGYHPQLQPRIATVLGEINRLSENNVTLKGVDQLRRIANAARRSQDPSEGELGRHLIDKIDDFVASAGPGEFLAGDPAKGAAALKDARGLWSSVRKSELIDDAVERAQRRAASTGTGGNEDNAIRQNIRSILDNPKKVAAFSEEERAALDAIVRGTATQNMLRLVGRLAPNASALMTTGNLGAAAATGGASLPGTAVAAGAKAAADRMTLGNVGRASTVVRNQGQIPEGLNLTPNQRKFLEAAIRAGAIEFPDMVLPSPETAAR